MQLPDDLLYIPLRFAGRCQGCSNDLEQGIRAYWSRSSRAVWCVECSALEFRESESISAIKSKDSKWTDPEKQIHNNDLSKTDSEIGTTKTPWQQLCDYALFCVEAEAAESLVDYSQYSKRWFVHTGEEVVITGLTDSIAAPEGLDQNLGRGKTPIIYGWPTVIFTDKSHRTKVAPLFAVQIEAEHNDGGAVTLHAVMEPEINLAVVASGIFDSSAVEEIKELMLENAPFGDAVAFKEFSQEIAKILGLKIQSVPCAGRLDSQIARETGIHNVAISVLAEWSSYTTNLRDELSNLRSRQDWQGTAAAHLLSEVASEKQVIRGPLAAPLLCNQSQEEILEKMRTDKLTVVTGPPGTGKTQLVVNAVANAWLNGDKVLVTSTNNGAVDVAVSRADRDVGKGLLIRTGNREAREELPNHISGVVAGVEQQKGDLAMSRAGLQRATSARNDLLNKFVQLDELDSLMLRSSEKREEFEQKAQEASVQLWEDSKSVIHRLDFAAIERKATRLLKTKFFREWRTRRLRRKLGCMVHAKLEVIAKWAETSRRIAELQVGIDYCRQERRCLALELGGAEERLREADQKWSSASLDAIRAETTARIRAGGHALAGFSQSSASGGRLKRSITNSMSYLRGWACTALTAQNSFPLESDLFDLVIVDEASQCSLATVLPLAYRAKRLAIVGDPHQLNPIVSVGDGHLKEIARQTGFDNEQLRERGMHHKDGSAYAAFEYALKPLRPTILNEHYRSHPHIARWFNRTFYANALTVLTDVSNSSAQDRAIGWVDIEGEAERSSSGSWINRMEAAQVVRQIEVEFNAGCRSLGVIAPFQAQASRIRRLTQQKFGDELLDEISFVSGTAHRLQGDERDTIIISTVLSAQMPKGSIRWIEKERNLLNVAVSRARSRLVVIGHPQIGGLGGSTLASLRNYVRDEVSNERTVESGYADFRTDSRSEQLLLEALQINDFSPYAKINVEGYELDFALLEQGIMLNIEVDGRQHEDARGQRRRTDITRDRVLERLGWSVFRVPAWRCHEEIDQVIEEIGNERDRLLKSIGDRGRKHY